jgi:hypothetical protein
LRLPGRPAPLLGPIPGLGRGCRRGDPVLLRRSGADLARLLGATGDRSRAAAVGAAIQALADANPGIARLRGIALHCQGLAADDPEVLEQAAAAYRQGSPPLELARACEDVGAALGARARGRRRLLRCWRRPLTCTTSSRHPEISLGWTRPFEQWGHRRVAGAQKPANKRLG